MEAMDYTTLQVDLDGAVATVTLNRPDRANAMSAAMWPELRAAMRWADETDAVRVAILRGAGRHFTAGIDLAMLAGVERQVLGDCPARSREKLRRIVLDLQDCLNSVERCRKPVLAAIHGACVGGGVDLAVACDMRYCSREARFAVKEIDIGMTADVGTLQRLPRLIGEGMARELAYTGREVAGDEAAALRLVNRCYESPEALFAGVRGIADVIAAKSPLAVRGSKEMITYARDHSVADGLNYVATWNAALLLSKDLAEAAQAGRAGRPPVFDD
jgi:enoyl-CoA hydratase/carnithine racemase